MAQTLDSLLAESRDRLKAAGLESAGLDARHLISGLLYLALAALLTRGRESISDGMPLAFVPRSSAARRTSRSTGFSASGNSSA